MFESKINRGRANGYAPLDSGSKVPLSYLPSIQSTIDTGSFATTSSLQSLIDVTGSFATTSSLNSISESIDSRVGDLEIWSSSLGETFATDLEVSIVSSSVAATIGIVSQATGLLSTSSFNEYTASISTASLVNRLNSIENVSGSWITENETGSFATTGSNTFIGTQTINGLLTIVTPSAGVPNSVSNWNGQGGWNQSSYINLTTTGGTGMGLTVDVVAEGSGYIDINAITINTPGSGYTNGDVITIDNENNLPGTFTIGIEEGSGWTFNTSGSLTTPGDINVSGSIYANNLDGLISSSAQITDFGFISSSTDLSSLNSFTQSIDSRVDSLENATGSYITSLNGTISGSSQLTSSFDVRYAPSASYLTSLNGAYSSSIQTLGGSGVYSSSAQLPSGLISGSSQLTASYDTRYTLSGSVVSGTTPAGTISGSSQLTSSFDGRYVQTGSFNTLTASFNSFTASAQSVTTGSNSFNGTQTITGSLIITTGSFVGSQILANTSSLYLTSGSNMYVQNNGVVEITGSLKVNGITRFETVGGDEGGEIEFGVPQTNTTLSTRVVQDIWQNRLRIFDGNTKGVFIDLSKAPIGGAGEITWKSSGYVDAGTFVQLDNIKASVTTSGNRGLSIGAVSTNFSANIGGTFSNSAGAGGNSTQNIAYTTTASTSVFGWNFIAEGDTSTYIINDKTNSRMYRITMMIGPAYLGNFISIERLH